MSYAQLLMLCFLFQIHYSRCISIKKFVLSFPIFLERIARGSDADACGSPTTKQQLISPPLLSPSRKLRQQKPVEISLPPDYTSDTEYDNYPDGEHSANDLVQNLARLSPSPSASSSMVTDVSSASSVNVQTLKCTCHGEYFDTNDQLRMHYVIHQGRHFCEICSKSYANKSNLQEHVNTHYGTFITCKFEGCKKRFTSSRGYDLHVLKHESHTCQFCQKVLPSKEKLEAHVIVHASPKFKCKDCSKTFTRNADLTKHSNETCPYREINLGNEAEMSSASSRSTRSKESSDVEIINVVKNITNGRQKQKGETKKEKLDKLRDNHEKIMSRHPYSCSLCTKRCSSKDNIKTHFRQIHKHNNIYVCQNCLCGFPSRQALFTHKKVGSCTVGGRRNFATYEKL